jgi:hypothetical protein
MNTAEMIEAARNQPGIHCDGYRQHSACGDVECQLITRSKNGRDRTRAYFSIGARNISRAVAEQILAGEQV